MDIDTHIGGVRIDPVDYDQVMHRIREWVSKRSKSVPYIVQANALSIVKANEDEEYRLAVERSDLNVPDGMPLVWILRHRGARLRSRVYGPDLMKRMCAEGNARGWRCFLYGSTQEVLTRLVQALNADYPGLKIAGVHAPPVGEPIPDEDHETLGRISQLSPEILWVALGGPKQDIWMKRHANQLDVGLMHGVGAAFDYLSGNKRQAPSWMRNAGFEWLFRLITEPRRLFKRYTIANLKFAFYLLFR